MEPKIEHRRGRWQHGRRAAKALVLASAIAVSESCNDLVTQGDSASFLVLEQLVAAPGQTPNEFSNTLDSDVVSLVEQTVDGEVVLVPTVFPDVGRAIFRLGFRDPGTPANPTTPTSANFITVDRYRVVYRRADGRNTPGVDVPYPFDGGATVTVTDLQSLTFTVVRPQAKLEPPLLAMRAGGGALALTVVAEITFYGHDQTGATTNVVGQMLINFADFGDPE